MGFSLITDLTRTKKDFCHIKCRRNSPYGKGKHIPSKCIWDVDVFGFSNQFSDKCLLNMSFACWPFAVFNRVFSINQYYRGNRN